MSKLKHKPLEVSGKVLTNLLMLAYYLKSLPKDYGKFDMYQFCENLNGLADKLDIDVEVVKEAQAVMNECGTIACALGHAPSAGIKPKKEEDWWAYSSRCFFESEMDEWEWCFSGSWDTIDNSHIGAAKRILYLIDKGLPENHNKQRWGCEPLSYKR